MGPLPFDVTPSPRRRRRDAAGAFASRDSREKSRSKPAPIRSSWAGGPKTTRTREGARAKVLKGRSLEEAEVDGLTSVEAWAVLRQRRKSKWPSESKSKCQDACKSWFKK